MALVRSKPLSNSSSRRTESPETNLIPEGLVDVELTLDSKRVKLTNLQKPFWPELGITKRDLLNYYAASRKLSFRTWLEEQW